MKFSLPFLKHENGLGAPRRGFSRLKQEDLLFWGIVSLAGILILFLLWDAFLFYESDKHQVLLLPSLQPKQRISIEDIDQAIKLLDERNAEFERILKNEASK